jgi:hypothetical protein
MQALEIDCLESGEKNQGSIRHDLRENQTMAGAYECDLRRTQAEVVSAAATLRLLHKPARYL